MPGPEARHDGHFSINLHKKYKLQQVNKKNRILGENIILPDSLECSRHGMAFL